MDIDKIFGQAALTEVQRQRDNNANALANAVGRIAVLEAQLDEITRAAATAATQAQCRIIELGGFEG